MRHVIDATTSCRCNSKANSSNNSVYEHEKDACYVGICLILYDEPLLDNNLYSKENGGYHAPNDHEEHLTHMTIIFFLYIFILIYLWVGSKKWNNDYRDNNEDDAWDLQYGKEFIEE